MNVSYDFRLRAAETGHVLETTAEEGDWLSSCSCGSWSSTDKIQAHSDPTITWAKHVISATGRANFKPRTKDRQRPPDSGDPQR